MIAYAIYNKETDEFYSLRGWGVFPPTFFTEDNAKIVVRVEQKKIHGRAFEYSETLEIREFKLEEV